MIVDEEDFDALVEAVDNGQMRLADTFMVKVLAQLLDTVEEMHAKVEQMYEFLSSDDEDETVEKVEPEKEPASSKEEESVQNVKPTSKTKQAQKSSEETTVEIES